MLHVFLQARQVVAAILLLPIPYAPDIGGTLTCAHVLCLYLLLFACVDGTRGEGFRDFRFGAYDPLQSRRTVLRYPHLMLGQGANTPSRTGITQPAQPRSGSVAPTVGTPTPAAHASRVGAPRPHRSRPQSAFSSAFVKAHRWDGTNVNCPCSAATSLTSERCSCLRA